jgi:hypothetical protein
LPTLQRRVGCELGMANGLARQLWGRFFAPNKEPNKPKRPLDRKSLVQIRIRSTGRRCSARSRSSVASSVIFEILSVTLDALRRRGLIGEDDIEYILAVTEQGVTKSVGSAGHQTVVQMIRMCLQQLSLLKTIRYATSPTGDIDVPNCLSSPEKPRPIRPGAIGDLKPWPSAI